VAVDMEAAGLLAAARRRGVELAVGCCVADRLDAEGWRVDFDKPAVTSGVRALSKGRCLATSRDPRLDGKKLSKRHGATGGGRTTALGILPEAMRNFLALLGWCPQWEVP
jgi:hypothetical protein